MNEETRHGRVDPRTIQALTRPDKSLLTLYIFYAALTAFAFPITIIPLYFHFKTLRYRFDDRGVSVSYGILWRRESYLTYSRIQDIHVSRNIIERWLGIGTVEIQTAAGSAQAEERITGIREYADVRNFLYARMRGHAVPVVGQPQPAVATLTAIRDELRAIRLLLEGRRHV